MLDFLHTNHIGIGITFDRKLSLAIFLCIPKQKPHTHPGVPYDYEQLLAPVDLHQFPV